MKHIVKNIQSQHTEENMAKEKSGKDAGNNGMNKAQNLMERMLKNSTIKLTSPLVDTTIINETEPIQTKIPMLNLALSGKLKGGIQPGIVQLCGESRTFKSSFALTLAAAFLDSDPTAIVVFFDSEFGTKKEYFAAFGCDISRILWVPFQDIEELSFEYAKQLDGVTEDDKVMFICDSIGLSSSKRERENVENQLSKQDLSRPRALKSLFRIITPKILLKKKCAIFVNHIYMTLETYAQVQISGGSGSVLASNTILVITKRKAKDGDEHVGYEFVLKIFKSRSIRDNASIPIRVTFEGGIANYSGLCVLAESLGVIRKGRDGRSGAYVYDSLSGEEVKSLFKEVDSDQEFWELIFKETDLEYRIENMYKFGSSEKIDVEAEVDISLEVN